ncbi:MAG: hypothetical protein AAFU85_13740 [Planctomycetota bacterium]
MNPLRPIHQRFRPRFGFAIAAAFLTLGLPTSVEPAGIVFADDTNQEPADAAGERVFSGPQPGEKLKSFKVLHIEDDEPQELEIVTEDSEGVTLICFVHRLSNDDRILYGWGLVDFYAKRHPDLTSHVVLLSDEQGKMTDMLLRYARANMFPQSTVGLSIDGAEGPGFYGLNRHVAMTVLVGKDNKVVENLVFNAPNARDLEQIMVAVAKALDKPEPTLAAVQQELRAERQREMDKRVKASAVYKLAPNDELGRIMFGMVNGRGNLSLVAKRRSEQLRAWVGDSDDRKATLKKYCESVLSGKFNLNRYSRAALKALAAMD